MRYVMACMGLFCSTLVGCAMEVGESEEVGTSQQAIEGQKWTTPPDDWNLSEDGDENEVEDHPFEKPKEMIPALERIGRPEPVPWKGDVWTTPEPDREEPK